MLTDKAKSIVRAELRKKFGHSNLSEIRKYLKENAKSQYGCKFIELPLGGGGGGGVSVCYTSNSNHFASFYFKLQLVGMTSTLAFTKKDITKAGIERGCGNYFAL